jgi:hypothetical protein
MGADPRTIPFLAPAFTGAMSGADDAGWKAVRNGEFSLSSVTRTRRPRR